MTDILAQFQPGQIIGLVAVAGSLLVGLTAVVGGFWFHARLIGLKQDMVNRGMSVDEIRAVLAAGDGRGRGCRARHGCRV